MDKIIDRIRKLLALADLTKNPNEEEAASAARMAADLLQRHNLDMADLATPANPAIGPHASIYEPAYTQNRWKAVLCNGVAPTYFCRYYTTPEGLNGATLTFVGKQHNADVALSIATYLISTIARMANTAAAAAHAADKKTNPAKFRRSYAEGAAARMYHRLEQIRREAEAATPATPTTPGLPALYTQELALVDDFIKDMGLRPSSNHNQKHDLHAYAQGHKDAEAISLAAQIEHPENSGPAHLLSAQ